MGGRGRIGGGASTGVAAAAVAGFAVACCAVVPLALAAVSSLAIGAVLGIGAGILALVVLFALLIARQRRRRTFPPAGIAPSADRRPS